MSIAGPVEEGETVERSDQVGRLLSGDAFPIRVAVETRLVDATSMYILSKRDDRLGDEDVPTVIQSATVPASESG